MKKRAEAVENSDTWDQLILILRQNMFWSF